MSRPMPIHHPGRELRTEPDKSEPAHSYDHQDINPLLEEEDEFHQRLQKSRGGGGGSGGTSFWRTASNSSQQDQSPSFTSVSLNNKSGGKDATVRTTNGGLTSGSLGAALGSYNNSNNNNISNNNNNPSSPTTPNRNDPWKSPGAGNRTSGGTRDESKKQRDQQRKMEARLKRESLENEVEAGHPDVHVVIEPPREGTFADLMSHSSGTTLDRSTSDQSTGSILYGKTPNPGAILGKSTSLIFPTGVETGEDGGNSAHRSGDDASTRESREAKHRKINLLLDQCETVRFPFKKKLILSNLRMTTADIPLNYLSGTPSGNSLHKLSLSGNHLGSIPEQLVQTLPALKHLDLSQCRLHTLPGKWNLPQLKKLDLSNNLLRDFPEENMLEGLPELQDLNMFGNKVTVIVVPHNPALLSRLETMDLGYNDIAYLPDELDQIRSLRVLKVRNNFLTKIPMRICDMELKSIDVSSNPVSVPPLETCERGICSMKRYYQQVRLEDQSKNNTIEEVQRRVARGKKKESKKKGGYSGFMKSLSLSKSSPSSTNRKGNSAHSTTPTPLVAPSLAHTTKQTAKPQPPSPHVAIPPGALVKPTLATESSDEHETAAELNAAVMKLQEKAQDITVNDTLKVIFVGMAMVGKTSMIKRLIEGKHAVVPTQDDRTVGVDIYAWDPKKDQRFEHIDSRIAFQDEELARTCGDVDVKFSVWDFAGQHVYHATHEIFFSSSALYVLVWDMGATNKSTLKRKSSLADEHGDFKLSYDSESEHGDSGDAEDDEESNDGFRVTEDARRADRALERDIDEKVQFWVDCIQSSAPGAAILPVASFADYFESDGGEAEAKRRCNMLRDRLLKHEQQRIQGIERRLQEYQDQNRADDPAAHRLRNLLCMQARPKLIFGEGGENSVVRVSGTQYYGFDLLTERIFDIATGRYRGRWRYPIFHGHVGTRIPRMRLQVRDAVRTMRDRFKVVEWGFFLNQLRETCGLTSVEDISDALHFLASIGELSYFGGVMANSMTGNKQPKFNPEIGSLGDSWGSDRKTAESDVDNTDNYRDDDLDDDNAMFSMDETSNTAPSSEDGSLSTADDFMAGGLSQFVFLNPRWLVAAVACILRHDLDREIKETKRLLEGRHVLERAGSFQEASLNCPVITAEDALMLWQAKKITKKAAERAQAYSNNMTVTPFEFLQLLLIRFGVFVPIDLSIEKALLGGKEYAKLVGSIQECTTSSEPNKATHPVSEVTVDHASNEELALKAKFFFLPSLLGPGEPSEAWTFKNSESWKTTLCHSVLFPDGVPPGLMERLTASILSSVYAVSNRQRGDGNLAAAATYEGVLTVREVLCWRTAFFLKLGTAVVGEDGSKKESIVEIFCHLADRDSHLCVGSEFMAVGTRRIIVSGRGQIGDGGRKIWKGGYLQVCKCVTRVMEGYGGLEYETQGFCPDCLAKKPVSQASWWEYTTIRSAVKNAEPTLRCHHHGHVVDTRMVAGPVESLQKKKDPNASLPEPDPVPVQDMLGAVVLVGLWDAKNRKVIRAGSGVLVDRRRGLIVTAAHTLMNVWGDTKYPFGENYYGLRHGKVVIGVIPDNEDTQSKKRGMAVFRYFAKIVAKDSSFEQGECHLDACVLRITTRMEKDVDGNGEECGDQPEILLLNNEKAFKEENLKALKTSEKCELEEQVRVLGFNQGGEGLLGPGESLNRFVDFARGYVCKKFVSANDDDKNKPAIEMGKTSRDCFKPREEIAVICPTIGGHSGGPCVNELGEVIGILSRADPADSQRCYLSPASEWKPLIRLAKKSDSSLNLV